MTGQVVPTLVPGSPEWRQALTASKVAAIVGVSPFESHFALWCRMAGLIDWQETTPAMTRGHYLEAGVCQFVADTFGVRIDVGSTFRHLDRDHFANPDRIVYDPNDAELAVRWPIAGVEVKTDAHNTWGEHLSTDPEAIPPHVRVQCLWGMHVTGWDRWYVGVLTKYLDLRAYVIERTAETADEIAYIVERVEAFAASLEAGEMPDADETDHTYQAIRDLHPEIDGTDVEVTRELAVDFARATEARKAADAWHRGTRNRLASVMGNARRAVVFSPDGKPLSVAVRQAKGDATPFVKAGAHLPRLLDDDQEVES